MFGKVINLAGKVLVLGFLAGSISGVCGEYKKSESSISTRDGLEIRAMTVDLSAIASGVSQEKLLYDVVYTDRTLSPLNEISKSIIDQIGVSRTFIF